MRSAGQCWKCKAEIWLPDALYEAAKRSSNIGFYCSYGHSAIFKEGETDLDKMRRERDRALQQIAERDDTINNLEHRRRAAVGQVTKIKNRVGHGVCPCCNRSFENLARHMNSKHPDFKKEEAA